MFGLVPVFLTADQAEVPVLEAEQEDVEAFVVVVALEAHHALVGDGKVGLFGQVNLIIPEELVSTVLLSEIESDIQSAGYIRDGEDDVVDAVFVDVAFGRDGSHVLGCEQFRCGTAAAKEGRLAPGSDGDAAEQEG